MGSHVVIANNLPRFILIYRTGTLTELVIVNCCGGGGAVYWARSFLLFFFKYFVVLFTPIHPKYRSSVHLHQIGGPN